MTRPVLLPLDGSPLAERAIPYALDLADRSGAPLALVSVISRAVAPRFVDHLGEIEAEIHEAAQQRADTYLRAVAARLSAAPGRRVHTRVLVGPVADALVSVADELRARIMVLTTHGRGPARRAWLGSVTDALLRRTPVPLLVIRPPEAEPGAALPDEGASAGGGELPDPPLRRIVLPVDGSDESKAAIPAALEWFGVSGRHFALLRIFPHHLPVWGSYLPDVARENERRKAGYLEAEEQIQELRRELESAGAAAESFLVEGGEPAEDLLSWSAGWEADAIAMTTRGRSGARRLFLGSVADKMIRGSRLPILVVPIGEEEGHAT